MTERGFDDESYKWYAKLLVYEIGAYYPIVASESCAALEDILSGIASEVIGHASSSEHATKQALQFDITEGRDLSSFLAYTEKYKRRDKAFAPVHHLMVKFRQQADKIIKNNNKRPGYTSTRNSVGKSAAANWASNNATKILEVYKVIYRRS